MSSPSRSYPSKGDWDRKYYADNSVAEDSVDSEAASTVLDSDGSPLSGSISVEGVQKYTLPESRKIGVVGAFFLILNKMIGTGSTFATWRLPTHNMIPYLVIL